MDQRRISSASSMDDESAEFEFRTPEKELLNAAELQSEWRISSPTWDEPPSTSLNQHFEALNRDLTKYFNMAPQVGFNSNVSDTPSTSGQRGDITSTSNRDLDTATIDMIPNENEPVYFQS